MVFLGVVVVVIFPKYPEAPLAVVFNLWEPVAGL